MLVYPIVDVDACESKGVSPVQLAAILGRFGVTLVQLRAKSLNSERLLTLAKAVKSALPAACRLVVNDRADVALAASCYGVHVGQEDMNVAAVREAAPGLAVGISTHNLAQVNTALRDQPDYVAIGPIFPTHSKKNPEPTVGIEVLRRAWHLCSERHVPLVAIGGVNPSNVHLVRPYCNYVAVIGAITYPDAGTVESAVRSFQPLHQA